MLLLILLLWWYKHAFVGSAVMVVQTCFRWVCCYGGNNELHVYIFYFSS